MLDRSVSMTATVLLGLIAMIDPARAQDSNSTPPVNPFSFKRTNTEGLVSFSPEKKKRWIRVDLVTVETFNIYLTPQEQELCRAESMEIRALLDRDTTALKNFWMQDFTLNEPQREVRIDLNPVPNYVSLHRTIERFTVFDDHTYVSGTEYAIRLTNEGRIPEQTKLTYTHLWMKKIFAWKLASKSYESTE